ncbi:MAG: TRAP transporter small permease subunit [Ignavibacteriae bacterium]|nr:TRAP transporter small permease subunit [Ignavibacteriota bacterium]
MTLLLALDRLLVRVEYAFLILFLGAMVSLAFMQVVLRNVFDTGVLWADTLVRHLVLWVGFTGAAIATHEGRHIGIDALTKFISPRAKSVVQIFTSLFSILACYFLGDAALTFLLDEKASGSEIMLSVPTWVGLLIVPFGYFLMAIHFVVKLAENAVDFMGRRKERT